MKGKAIIVDIDGTIAMNETGRDPFDYSLVINDSVDEKVKRVVDVFYTAGCDIIFLTARDDVADKDTRLWLEKNKIPYDFLFMRKTGDRRQDTEMKAEVYNNEIKDKFDVLCVLDDRDRVVDMWRSIGLLCLQVYRHE